MSLSSLALLFHLRKSELCKNGGTCDRVSLMLNVKSRASPVADTCTACSSGGCLARSNACMRERDESLSLTWVRSIVGKFEWARVHLPSRPPTKE